MSRRSTRDVSAGAHIEANVITMGPVSGQAPGPEVNAVNVGGPATLADYAGGTVVVSKP
jgi:hypothetical protein